MSTRRASLAMDTDDIDCVYYRAYPEIIWGISGCGSWHDITSLIWRSNSRGKVRNPALAGPFFQEFEYNNFTQKNWQYLHNY